jgi:hypothetical protein
LVQPYSYKLYLAGDTPDKKEVALMFSYYDKVEYFDQKRATGLFEGKPVTLDLSPVDGKKLEIKVTDTIYNLENLPISSPIL